MTSPLQSHRKRRFSSLKKEHGLELRSRGSIGDLYWGRKLGNFLVKKYKKRDTEKTTCAVARIQDLVEKFVSSSGAFSSRLELLPILEIGRDYITKEHFTLGVRMESMGCDYPDKDEALSFLNQLLFLIKYRCDSNQDLAKDVLTHSLQFGNGHVFWSCGKRKLIIPDLVITEEHLNRISSASVDRHGA
jgi:hypothetical protein